MRMDIHCDPTEGEGHGGEKRDDDIADESLIFKERLIAIEKSKGGKDDDKANQVDEKGDSSSQAKQEEEKYRVSLGVSRLEGMGRFGWEIASTSLSK